MLARFLIAAVLHRFDYRCNIYFWCMFNFWVRQALNLCDGAFPRFLKTRSPGLESRCEYREKKTAGPSTTLPRHAGKGRSGSTAGRDRRDERESSAPQVDPGANGPRFSAAPTALR